MKKENLIEFVGKYTKVFAVFAIFVFGIFLVYVANVNSPSFISVGFIVLLFGFSAGVAVAFFAIQGMVLEIEIQGNSDN